ncbi:protein IQ-DOMAIN 1-like [Chenopodium quinoa]|nr:protein IQ-DOMAIN 1-like [Chenopodium quinoa]
MGKAGGTSWITAVKKVFRSPMKSSPKKNCKRKEECARDDEEEEKKTEKRRWIFRKNSSHNQQYEANMTSKEVQADSISIHQHRRIIAAAEASIAAAKSAVATTKTAIRVQNIIPAYLAREYYAALIIQTVFRGYLARRALRALKGIVKLQALVRGHNIRKQAKTTLKCMQALIRVQAKLCDQSSPKVSHGLTRKSMFAESNNLWDKYKNICQRKPMSGDENSIEEQCKSPLYTIEDIEAMFQSKKEASLCREQALAFALSQQIRRFDQKVYPKDEKDQENKDNEWLSQWLDSKEYSENHIRLTKHKIEAVKNVEMESLPPHLSTPTSFQRSQQHRRHSLHVASPGLNTTRPMTPSLRDTRPQQVQSASPRCSKGYKSHSAANTPSLRLSTTTPNYMAATESARDRARTQSTPRQRHSTSDREVRGGSSVRKRLSFPNPDPQYLGNIYTTDYSSFSQNLRSPSFRSVQEGMYSRIDRATTCSSYTDITGGEISPASTRSHLRRWLS